MILCVTPNPAIDRTLVVPGLRLGGVLRASESLVAAGGKGLNVARALRALGAEPLCMGLLGGLTGQNLARLAEREGLRSAWTWCAGETRSCLILVDAVEGSATVVNEPGPSLGPEDWGQLQADVLTQADRVEHVCVSGSLPPGIPPAALSPLCRSLARLGKIPWIDTSGAALAEVIERGAGCIKVNGEEAAEVLGRPLDSVSAAAAAARQLRERGLLFVALTLGASGAVLASEAGCWHAQPPLLEPVSAVGSGDSFLAGLVAAVAAGLPTPEALRRGVAAGAANVLSPGGARFSSQDFASVLDATRVAPMA